MLEITPLVMTVLAILSIQCNEKYGKRERLLGGKSGLL